MEKLIDYTKYTIALAVGLLLYIPANLLPAERNWPFFVLLIVLIALALSILFGILLYSRATVVLIGNKDATEDEKGYTRLWGNGHLILLAISFVAATPYFVWRKVLKPAPDIECSAPLGNVNGVDMVLTFPCKSREIAIEAQKSD